MSSEMATSFISRSYIVLYLYITNPGPSVIVVRFYTEVEVAFIQAGRVNEVDGIILHVSIPVEGLRDRFTPPQVCRKHVAIVDAHLNLKTVQINLLCFQ